MITVRSVELPLLIGLCHKASSTIDGSFVVPPVVVARTENLVAAPPIRREWSYLASTVGLTRS
jgi:hypothetical protein